MNKRKKLVIACAGIIGIILVWNHLPYHYNNEKVAEYATKHAAPHSRVMCAGYVIRAMWNGGCPIGLVPAYAYNTILPQMGFVEISTKNYSPRRGDISVLPQNSHSPFGHIAIYNGNQWISDYKQDSIYPSGAYRSAGKYQIFRASDGWHWKHVWTSPSQWKDWLVAVFHGWKKIKF